MVQKISYKIILYLTELKYYIFYSILILLSILLIHYFYFSEIIYLYLYPLLVQKINSTYNKLDYLIYTNLTDILFVYLEIYFYTTFFLFVFFFLWQLFYFFNNSLYKYEKYKLKICYFINLIFFILNFLITYFCILPLICYFFLNFQNNSPINTFNLYFEGRLDTYLIFIFSLIIKTNFILSLPLVLLILWNYKLVSIHILVTYRKFIYLLLIIITAIISPPDLISQCFLIIFFILTIEFGLIFIHILEKYV